MCKKVFNIEVCVCIKIFNNTSSKRTKSIEQMRTITLCRSNNTPIDRTNNERPVKVIENSDFELILEEDRGYFSSHNLELYEKACKKIKNITYKNSSDYTYKSTIVVPIRVQSDLISKIKNANTIVNKTHNVYGFLCLDSDKPFNKWKMKNYYDDLIKSLGDFLYIMFYEINAIEDNIKFGMSAKKNEQLMQCQ